jgi:MFS transporter, DHA2 family, multidrug resistance protein
MINKNLSIKNYELKGIELIIAALVIASSNFIVLLDMTIANVSVPDIAGGLAVTINEGVYVITSYSVAEAIIVPLTGWLAHRFGTVKLYTNCIILFGIFSFLCGISQNLGMLVFFRLMQGISGGPLISLSQTLLMTIFPENKKTQAMTIWSMTTMMAPVMGPVVGGYICDNYGWSWIFFINIPLALFIGITASRLLANFETKIVLQKIDYIGLLLLILSVGSFQYILDEGSQLDWFESNLIRVLSIISFVSFVIFIIWELYDPYPVVNLSIFKNMNFSISVITIGLVFGAYFSTIVLLPLWLQTNMGYTSLWAGLVVVGNGISGFLAAPIAAKFSSKFNLKYTVIVAVIWLGVINFIRSYSNNDMTYFDIIWPVFLQGIAIPFIFIPLSTLALTGVDKKDLASAAGLMNFIRTLCCAFATSIITTLWKDNIIIKKQQLLNTITSTDIDLVLLDALVHSQSSTLSFNEMFQNLTIIFAATTILLVVALRIKK